MEVLGWERTYSFYYFLTSALERGERVVLYHGCALPVGKGLPVSTVQARWAPEPIWMQRLEENSFASVGDQTPILQSIVRHCTD
jgi:hypothetical protein